MKFIKIDKDRWIKGLNIREVSLEHFEEDWVVTLELSGKSKKADKYFWDFRYSTEEAARSKLNDILNQARK